MSSLLVMEGIEKAWGDRRVLRGADLRVGDGERVGLVGPNGCGKSTLLRIAAGVESADHGAVDRGGRIGFLAQEPELPGETVGDAADEAIAWHRTLLADYEALVATDPVAALPLQDRLDRVGWSAVHRIDALLDKLGAPPRAAAIASLSGGERRRVALARALLGQPELLVLDEPTNHLDEAATEWLQDQLTAWSGAVLFVTHDRYLLEAVADRIVEVDDGVAVSYAGSYTDYLIERAERRASQQRGEDARLAMLAREAEWASRSPAARSTKQKARLERLAELRRVRPLRPEESLELDLRGAARGSTTAVEVRGLRKAWGDKVVVRDLDLSLARGARLGILGPNGAGKSTLLGLLGGRLAPDAGERVQGGGVQVALFDQNRTGLPDGGTVADAAAAGNRWVTLGDRPVHVAGFLQRFLFRKEALDQDVRTLSGGERARLLLARLLLRGANLLLLDEPTNDLDVTTLAVLEEALLAFDGTAVIVTHDRAFLDRVCTAVLAPVGDGTWLEFADRQQARRHLAAAAAAPPPPKAAPRPVRKTGPTRAERQEREALPGRIDALERESTELAARLADPATWRDPVAPALAARLQAIPVELEGLYARWLALEDDAG